MKTGYRRFDIWFAELNEINEENHFVVIVSNWKNNIKSDSITCCMITSKFKKLPCRVNIKGFGLKKESQIKCEKIMTVEKKNLVFKLGNIDDIYTQLEIEKVLMSQLQLDNKYSSFNNANLEDAEKIFEDGVKKMRNKSQFKINQIEIFNSFQDKDFNECINKCSILIEKSTNDDKSIKWYGYYHLALAYFKLNNFEVALENAKLCLKYTAINEENTNYSYTMFLLASCYEKLSQSDKALNIYSNLSSYYKNIGNVNLRISVLCNISKILKNKNRIISLIRIGESYTCNEYQTDRTKKNIIMDMKKDLNELQEIN